MLVRPSLVYREIRQWALAWRSVERLWCNAYPEIRVSYSGGAFCAQSQLRDNCWNVIQQTPIPSTDEEWQWTVVKRRLGASLF